MTAPTPNRRLEAEEAIKYALENLEPFELYFFFQDWIQGSDMDHWTNSVAELSTWHPNEDVVCVDLRSKENDHERADRPPKAERIPQVS